MPMLCFTLDKELFWIIKNHNLNESLGWNSCCGGEVEWLPWGYMPCEDVVDPREYTCGWPPRIKEITMSSLFSVLPVQPFDILVSILNN
jgi:hypothetical protein